MSYFDYDLKIHNQDSKYTQFQPSDTTKQELPLFEWPKKQSYDKFTLTPFLPKRKQIKTPQVGNITNPFEEKTKSMLYKTNHKTHLLDVAQNHLGIQEVTEEEYYSLPPRQRNNTQMHLIGKFGTANHQWCAHTVSHIAEEAGMNIGGHKKAVKEFIDWGKQNNTYKPIITNEIYPTNFMTERYHRESQIKEQMKNMHEGDFIIWKSSFVAVLPNGEFSEQQASHIGILESVNPDGTITVIEGNANEYKTDKAERELVTTEKEGIKGNQTVGEFQEINRRDGLIRKTYTAKDLAAFGYSGYIDNQKIVK